MFSIYDVSFREHTINRCQKKANILAFSCKSHHHINTFQEPVGSHMCRFPISFLKTMTLFSEEERWFIQLICYWAAAF